MSKIFNKGNSWHFLHAFFLLLQLVFGIAVIGLYAQDLHRANREHKYSDGKWVYATVTGSLSSVTAVVYMIVLFLASHGTINLLFPWDFVLFILWAAVFGIFGKMYIGTGVEMQPGIRRMKNAVWIDLINMLLWFISFAWGVWMFFFGTHRRSLHLGRAKD